MNILELLNSRQKQRAVVRERLLTTGIVVRGEGHRYVVNDGASSIVADNAARETFVAGDRVYLLRDRGVTLIVGLMARDKDV